MKANEHKNVLEHISDMDKIIYLFDTLGKQMAKYVNKSYNIRYNAINVK